MVENVAERQADDQSCTANSRAPTATMKRSRGGGAHMNYHCPTGKAAVAILVLSAIASSSNAFSPCGLGGGVMTNYPLPVGLRYRGNVRVVKGFATTNSQPRPSSVAAETTTRHMQEIDNDEGKLKKIPEAGNSVVGATESYLFNITGSEEERAKETNKAKLREAVNEVKGAARVVKEKTSKLKNEVLKEDIKVVETPAMFEDSSVTYEDNAGRKLKQNENGKPKSKKVEKVAATLGEVTESTAKLGGTVVKKSPSILGRLFLLLVSTEMRKDLNRRKVHYISDWVDGFKNKRQTIPAILFLYFACLSPAVSFGTISSQLTNGSIGVVEFLLSCGASGMVSIHGRAMYVMLTDYSPLSCSTHFPAHLFCYSIGILGSLWTANGIHCADGPNIGFYFWSISIVHFERTALLSHLCLGWHLDVVFYDKSWDGRVIAPHSILHSVYR